MCGITGILELKEKNAVDRKLLKKMTDILSYRGPDGDGFYVDENCGLGHRRLSIIDLSKRGKQPMSNEDGSVWITFNGEIYNFNEIKDALEKRGHKFRSDTDTEVIIHGYEEYGRSIVKKLRGMFAFAIWDTNKKSLFLARDRLGKKPLFYHYDGKRFVLASELKAILQDGSIIKEINKEALSHYLTLGYVPSPYSIFKNIFKLKPAHTLTVDKKGLRIEEYWDLNYVSEDRPLSYYTKRLVKELDEATKMRLRSDVPLGAFLSGGIDSSAVVAFMAKNSPNQIKTFSIGFEEKSFDETRYARMVAEKFGTDHREFVVKENSIDKIPELLWHYNEPYADASAIPTYFLSKMTKKYVTVALNGDGGDENFAGYDRYAGDKIIDYYNKVPKLLKKPFESLVFKLPEPTRTKHPIKMTKRVIETSRMNPLDRYLMFLAHFNSMSKSALLSPSFNAGESTNDFMKTYFSKQEDLTNKKLYLDMKTYLPDDLLVKVDIATMAVSLEGRSPFLDHKFVEFTSSIPPHYKLHGLTKKYVLKKALLPIIPKEILYRRKMGFGVPVGAWFRNDLRSIAHNLILGKDAYSGEYFSRDYIEKLFYEHSSGKIDHSYRLWNLLCLEVWLRTYLSEDPKTAPITWDKLA